MTPTFRVVFKSNATVLLELVIYGVEKLVVTFLFITSDVLHWESDCFYYQLILVRSQYHLHCY